MRRLDDSRLIALIRTGGDVGLEAMYLQYRDEFLGWGRRFLKADEDELVSVYRQGMSSSGPTCFR